MKRWPESRLAVRFALEGRGAWAAHRACGKTIAGIGIAFLVAAISPAEGARNPRRTDSPLAFRPDLIASITSISAPVTVGRAIVIDWRDSNVGDASTGAIWVDRVFLSADATPSPATDLQLGTTGQIGPVNAGGEVNPSLASSIPTTLEPGTYWVYVQTDAFGTVLEEVETNNFSLPTMVAIAAPSGVDEGTILGLFDDQGLTVTSGAFTPFTPKRVYIGLTFGAASPGELSSLEFSIAGIPNTSVWVKNDPVFANANVNLGTAWAPADTASGAGGVNVAWPSCRIGASGRLLVGYFDVLFIGATAPTNIELRIRRRFPPTNATFPYPLLTRCDGPIFSKAAVSGGSYVLNPSVPQTTILTGPANGSCSVAGIPMTFTWEGTGSPTEYEYRIDTDPVVVTTQTTTTFSLVVPGQHRFEVAARNSIGIDASPDVRTFRIGDIDLAVGTTQSIPTLLAPRQPGTATWTDASVGGCNVTATWTDRLYLSSDDAFSPGTDSLLATASTNASSTASANFFAPEVPSGAYRILAVIDATGAIPESNEQNNVAVLGIVTIRNPRDTPPETAIAGGLAGACTPTDDVTVQWSGEDFAFPVSGALEFGYSLDNEPRVFVTATSRLFSNLPAGPHQVTVAARNQFGLVDPSPASVSFNVGLVDLVPAAVVTTPLPATTPPLLFAGGGASVAWLDSNLGGCPASGTWTDRIYLSTDAVFSQADSMIASVAVGATIAGGQSRSQSRTIALPSVPGNFWLFVVTDAGSTLVEQDEANNQSTGQQITVLRSPDLVPVSVTAPESASSGQGIYVNWAVRNNGGSTLGLDWREAVFLVDSDPQTPDIELAPRFDYPVTLPAGGEYPHVHGVVLPADIQGPRWIRVCADYTQTIPEFEGGGESNNCLTTAAPIQVRLTPQTNLVVDSLVASASVIEAGSNLDVVWRVHNVGDAATQSAIWYDDVFLLTPGGAVESRVRTSVRNLTYLNANHHPGDAYIGRLVLSLPRNLPAGAYRIAVATDSRNNVDEHYAASEADNQTTIPLAITRGQYPRPDLTVPAFNPPSTWWLGNPVNVSWQVQNSGTAATSNAIGDWVLLSPDPAPTPHTDFQGIGGTFTGRILQAPDAYSTVATFAVPEYLLAAPENEKTYYAYVWTDVGLTQDEDDIGNNFSEVKTIVVRRPPPPDFTVEPIVVTAPASPTAGDAVRVDWTVTNRGAGPGSRPFFIDAIYLSEDPFVGGDVRYGPYSHDRLLEPTLGAPNAESSDSKSATITIPGGQTGTRYLIVRTNDDGAIGEGDTSNNIAVSSPIIIGDPAPSNLVLGAVTAAGAPISGRTVTVSWSVRNDSPNAVRATTWADAVFFSQTPDLAAGAVPAVTVPRGAGLPYTTVAPVRIPDGFSGLWYVVVRTDQAHQVFEAGRTNDNEGRTSLSVSLVPPDLEPSDLAAPDSVDAGTQPFAVQWKVANHGDGPTQTDTWRDRVWVSQDTVLQASDTPLAVETRTGILSQSQAYTRAPEVVVPVTFAGPGYLLVKTDADDQVYEHLREGNNLGRRRIFVRNITPPPPNLQASVEAFTEGLQDEAVLHIVNTGGPVPANQRAWHDRLYWSSNDALDGSDPEVASVPHVGDVAAGGYTSTVPFRRPNGFDGAGFLFVRCDANSRVTESDETDNTGRRPVVVHLQAADLTATDSSTVTAVVAGQFATLQWRVRNIGNGLPDRSDWVDRVVLSPDSLLDSSDETLGSVAHHGGLGVGASYVAAARVQIRLGVQGRHYLFIATDFQGVGASGDVFELREDNNAVGRGILVTTPDPADLIVASVTPPDSAVTGEMATINWTVTNQLPTTVNGEWTDAVYASTDATWSLNDVRLGEMPHSGPLGPGASYRSSITMTKAELWHRLQASPLQALVPGLLPGGYRIIVRTDALNGILETVESNNDGASVASMEVSVVALEDGVTTPSKPIASGERHYYRFPLGGAEDARIVVETSLGDELEIVANYGSIPDRIDPGFRDSAPGGTFEFIIPRTGPGDLFLSLVGNFVVGGASYQVTPHRVEFGLVNVTPNIVGNGGLARFQLVGGQMRQFSLELRAGTVHLQPWRVDSLSTARAVGYFDLTGIDPGAYDIVLHNPEHGESTLPVTVRPGTGPRVDAVILGPDAIRSGSTIDYDVNLTNHGDRTAFDVLTEVRIDSLVDYEFVFGGVPQGARISDGQRQLLHTDAIGVGETAEFTIRVRGELSEMEIRVLSVQDVASLALVAGSPKVVPPWALGAAGPFAARLTSGGTAVDGASLQAQLMSTWPQNQSAPVTRLVREVLDGALQDALRRLPGNPPPGTLLDAGVDVASATVGADYDRIAAEQRFRTRRRRVALRVAQDPNEKIGSAAAGGDNFVSQDDAIPYAIHFENVAGAQASAQRVTVTDVLDSLVDVRTFRLGEIQFGNRVIQIPGNRSLFSRRIPLGNGLLLDVDASIDVPTRLARWTLSTVDSITGFAPSDPSVGFLPPNHTSPEGQGHVRFTVRPRAEVVDGDVIRNIANIIFDDNAAIVTNEVVNVVRRTEVDLRVEGFQADSDVSLVEGAPLRILTTILNDGAARAGAFRVRIWDGDPDQGGTIIDDNGRISSLEPGSNRSVSASWTLPPGAVGARTIVVEADPSAAVAESDELNNRRAFSIQIAPRSYSVQLGFGINLVAPPLHPAAPMSARTFASQCGTPVVARVNAAGQFDAFAVSDPDDGFMIDEHRAYVVELAAPRTMLFEGVSQNGTVAYNQGLNAFGIPLENRALTASLLALQLGAAQLVRYNTAAQKFEAYLPAVHGGTGFPLRGGEGLLTVLPNATAVQYTGTGWQGAQAGQAPWSGKAAAPAASREPGGESKLFVAAGTLIENRYGQWVPAAGAFTVRVENLRTGVAVEGSNRDTGGFGIPLVDLQASRSTRTGDRIRVSVLDAAGRAVVPPAELAVTAEQVAAKHARLAIAVPAVPAKTALHANIPNPFNPSTRIRYQIAKAGPVSLRVFDARGRAVKTLVAQAQLPGYYEAAWDGTDDRKTSVASGVYFYRLSALEHESTRKMVMVR